MDLKRKKIKISRRYRAELRHQLSRGPRLSNGRAEALGKSAMADGLEMLDLAHIRGDALVELMPEGCTPKWSVTPSASNPLPAAAR
jgi:hypothetical protein